MQKYGWFSPPEFITTGDPYVKRGANQDTRTKGAQMLIQPGKKGNTHMKGVVFSKPLRLFEGENYITLTQFKNKERARLEAEYNAKMGEPFRPTNPGRHSTGPGTFHGTFGGKVEYLSDGIYAKPKVYGGHETKANILTTPAKLGSYGTAGITLGKYGTGLGNKGIVNEFEYTSEPYDGPRQLEIAKRKEEREALGNQEPFRPTNPSKKGTYGTPGTAINSHSQLIVKETRGVCGEYTYMEQGPGVKKSNRRPGEGTPEGKEPFKPPAPPKSGKTWKNATLGPFPEHIPDPFDLNEALRKSQIAAEKAKKNKDEEFRPSSLPKSLPTRSVFRMNLLK